MIFRKEKLVQIGVIIAVAIGVVFVFIYFGEKSDNISEDTAEQIFESDMQRRARLLHPANQQQLTQEMYEEMSKRAEQLLPVNSEARKTEEEKIQIHEALLPKGQ